MTSPLGRKLLPFKLFIFCCLLMAAWYFVPFGLHAYDYTPEGFEKRLQRFTLDNGLRVLMFERPFSPTVALYIRYRVGSMNEPEGKTGMAHLLEHMLFKGTETVGSLNYRREKRLLSRIFHVGAALDSETAKGAFADPARMAMLRKRLAHLQKEHRNLFLSNEIDRLYKENGAVNVNASTGQDVTTYHVSLPANRLELWARIESDRMTKTVFREFYQERDVVLEERKQRIDAKPNGKLWESFYRTAFASHPYGRPVIGLAEDIKRLTPQDVAEYYRRTHTADNTVIAVVGAINTTDVRRMIEHYFGPLPKAGQPYPLPSPEPPQGGERRVVLSLDANPEIIIGYHKPPLNHQDNYVFEVIEALLSRGKTSRFYQELVERRGLADYMHAENGVPGARCPNLFVLFGRPRHPHGAASLEKAVYEIVEGLKTEPVAEEELSRIKTNIRADFIRTQSSNEGLAAQLSYFEALTGDYRYITTYPSKIEAVTAADIMRVAQIYLHSANRTVAVIEKVN